MGRFPTPHAHHRHVFVVMRLSKPAALPGEGPLSEEDITLTKAFLTEEAAQREADRLNDLNGEGWSYSVNVARLVEEPQTPRMRE
jgi:hypothetical protein